MRSASKVYKEMISIKIKESVENYKVLFDLVPVSIFIIDPSNVTIIDANREAIKQYKYKKDELIGMRITKLDHNILENEIDDVKAILEQSNDIAFETIHTTKDGKKINVMANVSKITIDGCIYYLAVHTDITNNIKTHKELQKHKGVLESIVKIQNELISNTDFDNTINNMLKTMCKSLDVKRAYVFKNSIFENKLVFSQIFKYVQDETAESSDENHIKNIPYKDCFPKWVKELSKNNIIEGFTKDFPKDERSILKKQNIKSILVVPIFKDGNWSGFIGLAESDNDRVWGKLEKDMVQTAVNLYVNAEYKHQQSQALQKTIESQMKHISDKDKILLQQSKQAQMGEMVNMIAHQWRQPLNTISATAISLSLKSEMDMLQKNTIKDGTQIIQDQCQKMSSTINTFMSFVKPNKEQKPFKLSTAVESIMKIMGTQLTNHNIDVNIISSNDKISIVGHEDLLEQVLINLFANSRDAFDDLEIAYKYINVNIKMQDNKPVIIIEDNAGGIDEEFKDKVFNPYFTTKEQGKGSGLGLYISQDIIKKSFKGNLTHENTQNGSVFKIIFG